MLETDLFALLECTGDAAYTVSEDGEIHSWNAAAERLFGIAAADAIGRSVDDVLDARDSLGTDPLAGGADAVTRRGDAAHDIVPAFDLDVRTASGQRIWVSVSTIRFDNPRTGRRLFARLLRDVSRHHEHELLLRRAVGIGRELAALTPGGAEHAPVEALTDQERRILQAFSQGHSAPRIAEMLHIAPNTLRNHLHRINRKLRTHTRLEAVTHARQRGLID